MKLIKILFLISTITIYVHPKHVQIQKSHLENSFYPGNKKLLQKTIRQLAKKASQKFNADLSHAAIKAIIVPHAAYTYSGAVAASVYKLLDKNVVKKIIILAPDHSVSFDGIALPTFDYYQTPLGKIRVDKKSVQKLAKYKLFKKNKKVFSTEHSLEVQLPFIKYFLKNNIEILPLIIGQVTCEQAYAIAQDLKSCIDINTVVVVSSDFTHYGSRFNYTPFTDNIFYNIRALDSQAVEYIEQAKCEQFESFIKKTKATICGHYPIEILLSLLEQNALGAVEPRLIAYDTSGQQENNTENSVSYIGMLFTQQKLDTLPIEQQLTQQEKSGLLQEAKDVLNNIFDNKISTELLYPIKSFGLKKTYGAFTTLEKLTTAGKELRGCIGRITTSEPLYKTVAIVTKDTALHDTRFKPVKKDELPELTLKISVLSPSRQVESYEDIIIGKHGVILERDNKSAVFLPEVPIEFKWDLNQMLTQLSIKGALPANAWQDKETKFKVFTTLDI